MNDIYHETLGQALQACKDYLTKEKAVSTELEDFLHTGGIGYGQTWRGHFHLSSLKGKNTRKYFHVSIYRMESGRYELTRYIG